MKFQILFLFLLIFFLLSLYQNSYGTLNITLTSTNQSTKVDVFDKDTQTSTIDIITPIIPILAIVLAIITLFLTPLINERFKLREQYIVPYKKWCTSLYGGLHEYKTLLCNFIDEKEIPNCNKNHKTRLSNDYIVLHFWELHDHISTGHMWLGKIHKDLGFKSDIDDNFKLFIDHIDKCWHNLEEKYKEIIGLYNQKDFTDVLRNATTTYYGNSKLLQQMVDTIREDLINTENPLLKDVDKKEYHECTFNKDLFDHGYKFNEELFEDMLKFLQKQIP